MERWLPIPGFTLFEASSEGRVRRTAYGFLTKGPRHPLPYVLTQTEKAQGYLDVSVQADGERQVAHRVHKLVALAFHGPPAPDCYMVCHRDGTKRNNRPGNLYWGNHKTNGADTRGHRTFAVRQEKWKHEHPTAKLSVDNVRHIKRRLKEGQFISSIAADYGVAESTIAMISAGRNWKWVEAA